MEVEAQIFYWAPEGMVRNRAPLITHAVAYVMKSEAERLLEEAHTRGFERGLQTVKEK